MKRRRSRRRQKPGYIIFILAVAAVAAGAGFGIFRILQSENNLPAPEELLLSYMEHIEKAEYEEMYAMLDAPSSDSISKEEFIQRNSAIYEGIGMHDMTVTITGYDKEREAVSYETFFETDAGKIDFSNEAFFQKEEDGYRLVWEDRLIFPGLRPSYKVRVFVTSARRGKILDRDG